jgi:hypothetical protein
MVPGLSVGQKPGMINEQSGHPDTSDSADFQFRIAFITRTGNLYDYDAGEERWSMLGISGGKMIISVLPDGHNLLITNSNFLLKNHIAVLTDTSGKEVCRFCVQPVYKMETDCWKSGTYEISLPSGAVTRFVK